MYGLRWLPKGKANAVMAFSEVREGRRKTEKA
jgi:hypothetical protein